MLQYRGFVRQDPGIEDLSAGPAITSVAFAVFGRIDIQGTATPIMRKLSERLRESVHMGVLEGAAVRFIAAVEGPTAVRVASRLGRRCRRTAHRQVRRCSRNCLNRSYIDFIPDEKLDRLTPHSIGSRTSLKLELGRIRERGYAVNREESEESVASLAVPIRLERPG